MRSYEDAVRIWGARKAGLPDDTDVVVSFVHHGGAIAGCDTCGPDFYAELTVGVRENRPGSREIVVIERDMTHDAAVFHEILAEVVAVARE